MTMKIQGTVMRVESGQLRWKGRAGSLDDAIIKALTHTPPRLNVLMRLHDGKRWFYLSSEAALKKAGYSCGAEIRDELRKK